MTTQERNYITGLIALAFVFGVIAYRFLEVVLT